MLALASDHAGYQLKAFIIKYLNSENIPFKDFGCFNEESVDYPVYALKAAKSVASYECEKGILVCGTGIGMSIAANKVKRIRCALCCNVFSAEMSRKHNDANMLAIGAKVVDTETALDIVKTFINTTFDGQRHLRRLKQIKSIQDFQNI